MLSMTLAVMVQSVVLSAQLPSLEEAYQRSVANGRPLVVLLGAEWCPSCVTMKNRVLPDAARAGAMNGVEFAYVDVDRDRAVAEKLSRDSAIPQLLRFDRRGERWAVQHLTGAQSVERVKSFLQPKPAVRSTPTEPGSLPQRTMAQWQADAPPAR